MPSGTGRAPAGAASRPLAACAAALGAATFSRGQRAHDATTSDGTHSPLLERWVAVLTW